MSDLAADLTPTYLEGHGFESVPKSVAYGYTASGYGFVQDMPYAYIHEFTRTSMAGKIRRFKGGYTSFWDKISKSLAVKVLCNTEVLKVRRNALGVRIVVKNVNGNSEVMEFDKIIISGAFPFRNRKTYRSPVSNPTGLSTCVHLVFFFFVSSSTLGSGDDMDGVRVLHSFPHPLSLLNRIDFFFSWYRK